MITYTSYDTKKWQLRADIKVGVMNIIVITMITSVMYIMSYVMYT